MADLKVADTSYPGAIDTATELANAENSDAQHINGPVSAILALETELGTDVAGTASSLKERLAAVVDSAGGILSGAAFPGTPVAVIHFFYRTDEDKLYIYDTGAAQYVEIPLSSYFTSLVRTNVATTITARHTFNTTVIGAPFSVGANSSGALVSGLNADKVDGYDINQALTQTSSPTFDNVTATTALKSDTVSERSAAAGVTVDGVLLKDSQVSTDTINEKTATVGVTIDGVLLKDSQVTTDVINEKTPATGVTADGVLLKDSTVVVDTISEQTAGVGVTIDGCLIKDNYARAKGILVAHAVAGANQGTTTYTIISGYDDGATAETTEDPVKQMAPGIGYFIGMTVQVGTNSLNGNLVATLRVNGSDTALTATITAGSTAVFTAAPQSIAWTDGNFCSVKWVAAAGTGSFATPKVSLIYYMYT